MSKFVAEDVAEVYRFEKEQGGEVRARLYTHGGHRPADLRYFVSKKDGELVPTQKGVSIRATQLEELKRAVDALVSEHEQS